MTVNTPQRSVLITRSSSPFHCAASLGRLPLWRRAAGSCIALQGEKVWPSRLSLITQADYNDSQSVCASGFFRPICSRAPWAAAHSPSRSSSTVSFGLVAHPGKSGRSPGGADVNWIGLLNCLFQPSLFPFKVQTPKADLIILLLGSLQKLRARQEKVK